jgi:uncharacterized membrane protein
MNDRFPFQNRGGTFVYPGGPHHGGPSALAWTIFALELLLLLGIAGLLASTFGGRLRRPAIAAPHDDALETVRMRYARGDLSRDDYVQAVRDLGGTPADEAPTREI